MFLSMHLTRLFWANPRKWAKAPALLLWPGHLLLQAGPPVPLTCRRSVAGCHIFQPRGLAEETLARLSGCAWGRGAAVPLYIWGRCPRDVRPPAGHHRRVGAGGCKQEGAAPRSAAGNLWARPRAGCPGAAARRLRSSAWARERTARPLPPPPPPPPPPDLRALSMPGAGARPTASTPGPGGGGVAGRTATAPRFPGGERGEARACDPAPGRNPRWDGAWERGQTG